MDSSDAALSSAGSVGTRPPHRNLQRHVVRERLDDQAHGRRQATLIDIWSLYPGGESTSEHDDLYWETGIAD